MNAMNARDRIIVALDVENATEALVLVKALVPHVGYFKIGLELINSMLASIIGAENDNEAFFNLRAIQDLFNLLKGKIFWDGKFDDIPNTVGKAAVPIAQKIGVRMFNVHASAGLEAIKAAVANRGEAAVLGVTVLTSIDEDECKSLFGDTPGRKVLRFSQMLLKAGAQGIICSPQELTLLRADPSFDNLLKVTPGVRPDWSVAGDQKRITTPRKAIRDRATHLVIGRPITQPPAEIGGPAEAAQLIAKEIEEAL